MVEKKDILNLDKFSIKEINDLMNMADSFTEILKRDVKKVPVLRGKTIINLFFEPSTRTKVSFEIAAKRLSADLINFSPNLSSLKKGESEIDTLKTINAMKIDLVIIRHSDSGYINYFAKNIPVPVINAGDGKHEHPTQALLDLYTIYKNFSKLEGLKVAIVGDILNSRVARSDIKLFNKMGLDVKVVAPSMLIPQNFSCFNAKIHSNIEEVISEADVLYMLRMQFERQDKKFYPSTKEYNEFLSLNLSRLNKMKKDSIIMHPGPVNRGIEISDEVMEMQEIVKDKIKINTQVANGVAVRMAVLYYALS
ncbi:MAG: aspartate carbamoyltransferase catalytic subunit [Actinobacteria bacterium]|nr:aspartate carbamoyltransferase catalytic subunit [Actinomycetota bacterium]